MKHKTCCYNTQLKGGVRDTCRSPWRALRNQTHASGFLIKHLFLYRLGAGLLLLSYRYIQTASIKCPLQKCPLQTRTLLKPTYFNTSGLRLILHPKVQRNNNFVVVNIGLIYKRYQFVRLGIGLSMRVRESNGVFR